MPKFLMCGSCPTEALREVGVGYKEKTLKIAKMFNGEINAMYSTAGEYDLVLLIDLPDIESAMKASIELNKLTGVRFSTSPLIALEELFKSEED